MNDQLQKMNQQQMMNQLPPPPQMMNRNYALWPPVPENHSKFRQGFVTPNPGRSNWKGKKGVDKRRKDKGLILSGGGGGGAGVGGGGGGAGGGYKPPALHELQSQNRMKARRFYPKKKANRFAPYAPRNTTSFLIRAKKSGGIASLVSPCPVTPAVLPTPIFSPSREVLVDMAKEEWGVDGYGSMNGLIRLRSSPGRDEEEEEEGGGGSSESDVEEHVEVERRLDHDLSRFEMIYPNGGDENVNLLDNQVDDQDAHIAQLEEENLTLKERLYLMERELVDLRVRLQCLEAESRAEKGNNGEVLENDIEGGGDKEDNNGVENEMDGGNKEESDEDMLDNDEGESNKIEHRGTEKEADNGGILENDNNKENNREMLENETKCGGDNVVLENKNDRCGDKLENKIEDESDGSVDVCSEKCVGDAE